MTIVISENDKKVKSFDEEKIVNKARKYLKKYSLKDTVNLISEIEKIKNNFKHIDIILAPAMGGIIIGYEIGKILKKETIFCERVKGKFTLRRGFKIKKGSKVIIIEDVITTGKSSMECVKLIKKSNAILVGCLLYTSDAAD